VWESNRHTKSQTLCLRGVAPHTPQPIGTNSTDHRGRGTAWQGWCLARFVRPLPMAPSLWSEGSESLYDHCREPAGVCMGPERRKVGHCSGSGAGGLLLESLWHTRQRRIAGEPVSRIRQAPFENQQVPLNGCLCGKPAAGVFHYLKKQRTGRIVCRASNGAPALRQMRPALEPSMCRHNSARLRSTSLRPRVQRPAFSVFSRLIRFGANV
jgi:hypothetical protein